jgi:anti-sigma regulatory factor (Ser/Thr protein kinase)
VYRGDKGFLDVTVDYVRDGLAAGEPVLVALAPPKTALLREALGRAADLVRFIDMSQVGGNPARIIPMWRAAVEHASGSPIRGIGEPIWHGRRPAELAEALLHEALLNLAFADGPDLLLRCPYDAAVLPDAIVHDAHLRHPRVVGGDGSGCGIGYQGVGYQGVGAAATEFAVPLPEDGGCVAGVVVEFHDMVAVRRLRAMVGEQAQRLGIGDDRAADLMLAVHEIAANSLLHGGGWGTLRLWADDAAVVCEITDLGHIDQPLVGRIQPTADQVSGRGVWLANQLCDLTQLRSSASGTIVRMHMTL